MAESAVLKDEAGIDAQVSAVTADMGSEERLDDLTGRLAEVQSKELRKLLDHQNELIERLNGLADIKDVEEAERKRSIIESDLASTREQIAKRTENVGVMAAELMALFDELGLQSQKADEDSPEDEDKRQAAQQKVERAIVAVTEAQAAVKTGKTSLDEAENGWFPFGKQAKIDEAKAELTQAEENVPRAEAQLAEARENIQTVEAQIQIDKADRIRRASLAENFARIREFTGNAVNVLQDDAEQTEIRLGVTEKALTSALTRKAEVARDLDALRDTITSKERDYHREIQARGEIPDQGSEAFAKADQLVKQLDGGLTELRGQELELNTRLMALTAAAEANSSSLKGLTVQRDTSRVYIVKLETAEKTAEILGHNIDRMIKNTTQEAASDALDRANDKMVMTAVELGVRAEVSSAKSSNDALARHAEFMAQLKSTRSAGDEAIAVEAERYVQLDERVRAGYAAQGIDIDMSHLLQAAQTVGQPRRAAADDGEVSY
jgi:chromosome segregation ATPase